MELAKSLAELQSMAAGQNSNDKVRASDFIALIRLTNFVSLRVKLLW